MNDLVVSREESIREAASSDASGCRIPEHMVEGLVRYVIHGDRPGDAMQALLAHNFRGIMERCDFENLASLREWWLMLCNRVPIAAHGSEENVERWISAGGLNGKIERALAAEG